MASANTKEVFDCTRQEFFKIVSDYEKYPEFLPQVKAVSIYKKSDDFKEMEYHVSVIKTFKYKLRVKEVENTSVSFEFIGGDVFKAMKGSWHLSDHDNKCAVEYKVEASFGLLVPESIAKPLVTADLPVMMSNFRKRIKQIYGK